MFFCTFVSFANLLSALSYSSAHSLTSFCTLESFLSFAHVVLHFRYPPLIRQLSFRTFVFSSHSPIISAVLSAHPSTRYMPTRMRASRRWPRSPSRAPLVALNRSSPIVARLPNITHSIMANKRPLLPAVQSLPNAPRSLGAEPVDDDGGPPTQQPPTSKRQRHRHSAQEWAQQRELFTILYHRNGDSLENAIKLIEEERGFKAR